METTVKIPRRAIAFNIKQKIHLDKRLEHKDLAQYLGMSPPGLSQALKRGGMAIARHARGAARFFRCELSELTGLPEEVSQAIIPHESSSKPGRKAAKKHAKAAATAPSILEFTNAPTNGDTYALDPGCEMKRIKPEGAKGVRYVLLGPANRRPKITDKVYAETKDGRKLVRKYNTDEANPSRVVLMPMSDGGSVVVLEPSDVKEMRVIIGTLLIEEH